MIINYKNEIYRAIRFAYADLIDEMSEKHGEKWLKNAIVTPDNRASLERMTERRVLEAIADPVEEEKADPIVASCDGIIRLTLLPGLIKKHFDMLESEGRLI